MARSISHVEQLVIPVGGAGNCGHGQLSTAAAHLLPLRRRLATNDDRVVSQPIVPCGLGLLHSLDKTYRHYLEEIEQLCDRYPNAELVLVGHSLGGLLARRQAAQQPGNLRGVITLASPHNGLNPAVPAAIRREYRRFASSTGDTSQTPIIQIGSAHDELVPLSSSLAEIVGAERHEKSWMGHLPLTHNTVPLAPGIQQLAANCVNVCFGLQPIPAEQLTSLPRPA